MVTTSAATSVSASSSMHTEIQPRLPLSQAPGDSQATQDSSDDSDTASSTSQTSTTSDFILSQCLFCGSNSSSIDINLTHMAQTHGMTIPSPSHLAVDTSTLLAYLHLVVTTYFECLTCGTQRRTLQAIQQHMLGKGHCAFDISEPSSEYRDFWDFGDEETRVMGKEESMVLEGGKTAVQKSVYVPPRRQRHADMDVTSALPHFDQTSTASSISGPCPPTALTKSQRHELALSSHLSSLRQTDKISLLHLPSSQQRAVIATQKKQIEKARRQERDMQARVQRKGNQTLMKHFVSDVPGPKLG